MHNCLVETMRVENSSLCHVFYHNQRMNQSRKILFGAAENIDLEKCITVIPAGTHKCRVLYRAGIEAVHFLPPLKKERRSFRFIKGEVDYSFKYADRGAIDDLFARRGSADDIIIIRDGLVTDASSSNLAFFDGKNWITPAAPLLEGTTRQRLIDQGLIKTGKITPAQAASCKGIALMNAMIDFHVVENPVYFD